LIYEYVDSVNHEFRPVIDTLAGSHDLAAMQINKLLHHSKANSQNPFRTVEPSFTPDKEVENIRPQYRLNDYAVVMNANDN
jgi:hypothetical protein